MTNVCYSSFVGNLYSFFYKLFTFLYKIGTHLYHLKYNFQLCNKLYYLYNNFGKSCLSNLSKDYLSNTIGLCLALCLLGAVPAFSFDFGGAEGHIPIEIEAEHGIVCEQEQNKCTAHGQVKVTRGPVVLEADHIIAWFHKTQAQSQSQKLIRLEAIGHVVISSKEKPHQGFADHAVYDLLKKEATFTGQDLRLHVDNITVTAKDRIHYFEASQEVAAFGQATAVEGDHTLMADELRAFLQKNPDGKLYIQRIVAKQNVTITTPQEVVHGQQGEYRHANQLVYLEGDVKISHKGEKEGMQLQGAFAEVNLATGKSRLLAAKPGCVPQHKVKVLLMPNN